GPRREEGEHDPWAGDREPRAVDRPRLAGLELPAGAGVLAQERGQGPQEAPEVGAAHVAREAQRLDDAVGDGVRQPVLEQVEAVAEAARGAVVAREPRERLAELDRAALPELADRLGQRQPGAHARGEVVEHLGPRVAQPRTT